MSSEDHEVGRSLVWCEIWPGMKSILFLFGALILSGCAITKTGDDGTTRITGFVDLEIRSQDDSSTFAGYVADVQTIGFSILDTPAASGFSFGYNRQKIGFLQNNALVVGDALALDLPPQQ